MAERLLELRTETSLAEFDLADGCRLTRLEIGGRSLIVEDTSRGEFWWGAYLLAPWASTLYGGVVTGTDVTMPLDLGDAAVHGTARRQPFEWTGERAEAGFGPDWPFGGVISVTPTLRPDGLDLVLAVTAGEGEVPAEVGWHPWFPRQLEGVRGEIVLPSTPLVQQVDSRDVPTGEWKPRAHGPWNDCLRFLGPATVNWPGAGSLVVDGGTEYWVLFDDNDHGICVEPMTGPARMILGRVAPGDTLSLSISLTWIPASA